MSNKADLITAPHNLGDQDGYFNYNCLVFKVGTTHAEFKIPHRFTGKFVKICASGGEVHYAFSLDATAEVDATLSPTSGNADGLYLKQGGVLADSIAAKEHVMVPYVSNKLTQLYLIAEADTADTLIYVELSSS